MDDTNVVQEHIVDLVMGLLPNGIEMHSHSTPEEWLATRLEYITASEAAAICGESTYESPYSLYLRKRGISAPLSGEWLDWGHRLESVIAERYTEVTGRQVYDPGEYTLFVNPAHPLMAATLDRLTLFHDGLIIGPLELKTRAMQGFTPANWCDLEEEEYIPEDPVVVPYYTWDHEVPLDVQIQVQHQMICTGTTHGSVAVLIGGQKWRYCDVEANPTFQAALVGEVSRFWTDHVEPGIPPDVDSTRATTQALKQLHPNDNGFTVHLPPCAMDLDRRRLEINATRKALQSERDGIDNRLREMIGDHTFGGLPDGARYSLKTTTRKTTLSVPSPYGPQLEASEVPYEVSGGSTSRTLRRNRAKKRG